MDTLHFPVEHHGPGKAFEQLLSLASSPDNLLLDVVPDNTLRDLCDLQLNDGIVIDRGFTQPHTGGDYYLIQYGELRQVRQIMTLPNNTYHIATDHTQDIISRNDIQVIGKVLGSVKVRGGLL